MNYGVKKKDKQYEDNAFEYKISSRHTGFIHDSDIPALENHQ
jgi:hypothetical protein